jgi:hypothetical protein
VSVYKNSIRAYKDHLKDHIQAEEVKFKQQQKRLLEKK